MTLLMVEVYQVRLSPVKSAPFRQQALKEISKLLDAPEGTDEADNLELLSTLVESYEEKHFPTTVRFKTMIKPIVSVYQPQILEIQGRQTAIEWGSLQKERRLKSVELCRCCILF